MLDLAVTEVLATFGFKGLNLVFFIVVVFLIVLFYILIIVCLLSTVQVLFIPPNDLVFICKNLSLRRYFVLWGPSY